MNSCKCEVCVFMHGAKMYPREICAQERDKEQLCPIISLTPLHSQTADNAIRFHKYNKNKDKSNKQLGMTAMLESRKGNIVKCSSA